MRGYLCGWRASSGTCADRRCYSIHDLGLVGHIEDISVAKDQQGKKLGLRIIQALDHVAEKVGCYKVCGRFALACCLEGSSMEEEEERGEGSISGSREDARERKTDASDERGYAEGGSGPMG